MLLELVSDGKRAHDRELLGSLRLICHAFSLSTGLR